MKSIVAALIITSTLDNCANNSGSSRAREMNIRYGEITRVTRVPVPSAAPAGAIIGGFTGLVLARGSNPGRQAAAGIGGAALGGLATAALEGDRRAYRYHLRYSNGSETDFITENGNFREGDCISVERGQYSNLRRVSDALCESAPKAPEIVRKRETEAKQCHDAKDQVLRAMSETDIEQAARKVRILCQY